MSSCVGWEIWPHGVRAAEVARSRIKVYVKTRRNLPLNLKYGYESSLSIYQGISWFRIIIITHRYDKAAVKFVCLGWTEKCTRKLERSCTPPDTESCKFYQTRTTMSISTTSPWLWGDYRVAWIHTSHVHSISTALIPSSSAKSVHHYGDTCYTQHGWGNNEELSWDRAKRWCTWTWSLSWPWFAIQY